MLEAAAMLMDHAMPWSADSEIVPTSMLAWNDSHLYQDSTFSTKAKVTLLQ